MMEMNKKICMLKKVYSGFQTGADIAGIVTAKQFGYEVGGWMPKGFLTLDGPRPQYAKLYNAKEHSSSNYAPRTYCNARDSDGTIRLAFDFSTTGEVCTLKAINQYKKEHIDVNLNDPRSHQDVIDWLIENKIEVLNIAGNAERDRGTFKAVSTYLTKLFELLRDRVGPMTIEVETEVDASNENLIICAKRLRELGLYNDQYQQRLHLEFKEIDAQMEHDYLYDLYKKKLKFEKNENNLLVAYLLGLTDEFDIDKDPIYVQGEFPDVDMDYTSEVQDYLKNTWAAQTFGNRNVCSIGNYTTFGIKNSLIDMAFVHDKDRDEILNLTTKIGLKDDDGKALTWDRALEEYPLLKEYCDANPEVAFASKNMLHRNRGMGKHAGGLIISNQAIDNLVPLVIDKDGNQVSAFVEGLHGTDLGPLGLIKFDVLVITCLVKIAKACKFIKERHGLESIWAQPNQPDWSDIGYLNDPKALALADKGKLKCIFQFDSEGMQELVKNGGVTSFDDIPAYSSLYRPGPMGCGMHDAYAARKRGREKYDLHPVLAPILGSTYNVMVYQEQIIKILRIVGLIPDMHCEIIRKAISKKKIEIFGRYKVMFIKNGQKVLGWTAEKVKELWDQVESFSEYGFNKSVDSRTLIPFVENGQIFQKEIKDFVSGDRVYCINEAGETVETEVVALHDHDYLQGFEVTFDDGYQITCTSNHKFLTENGQVSLRDIYKTRSYILVDTKYKERHDEKTRRGMEIPLQSRVSKQKIVSRTLQRLFRLQKSKNQNKTSEIKIHGQMWRKNVNQREFVRTSKNMPRMPKIGMEKRNIGISIPMWNDVQYSKRAGCTSKSLRNLYRDETKQYSIKNGKTQRGQSISRTQENILGHSKKNINATRIVKATIRKFKEMERRESRRICQMHRSGLEKSKTFQNGKLASNSIKLANETNSLWRGKKTSRFCKRKYLDRSRWLLSFLQSSKQTKIRYSSSTRQNVERRVYKKSKYNAFENKHGMFSFIYRSDEDRDLGLGAGHAEITDTRNLVHRKIVRVVLVGECHMFDLEVANPTHNFLLPNGIVTSNSHAVAYSYLSSRMLWLKAHYPLEFFAAILSCEKNESKIKEYKHEAETMGLKIERVDINKSKNRFDIVDNVIYMGFSHIKGIGLEAGEEIVKHQPYSSLEDFLRRCTTDAKVVKPLIALRTFKEVDPVILYEYYEYFKSEKKKIDDRNKRFEESKVKYYDKMTVIAPDNLELIQLLLDSKLMEDKEFYEWMSDKAVLPITTQKELLKIVKKYKKSIESNISKNENNHLCSFEDFEPSGLIDPEVKSLLSDVIQLAEEQFYGFSWNHLIETSPEYTGGRTFADFDADETAYIRMCEVHVVQKPKQVTSKKGSTYWTLMVEDSTSKLAKVIFWENDFDRFKEELLFWESDTLKGHFFKMRLKRPDPPFNTYTFDSPKKQFRWREVPEDKADDNRLKVMARLPRPVLEEFIENSLPENKSGDFEIVKIDDSITMLMPSKEK